MIKKNISILILTTAIVIVSSYSSINPTRTEPGHTQEKKKLTVPEQIRLEGTKSAANLNDRPLPLAASWQDGSYPFRYTANCKNTPIDLCWSIYSTPAKQVELIKEGHHLLPSIGIQPYHYRASAECDGNFTKQLPDDYYEEALSQFREWGLPITIVTTQWEDALRFNCRYSTRAGKQSSLLTFTYDHCISNGEVNGIPNQITEKRTVNWILPCGNSSNWESVGRDYADSTKLKLVQQLYPDPPKVILLSNDESPKIGYEHFYHQPKPIITIDPTAPVSLAKPCNQYPQPFAATKEPYMKDVNYCNEYNMSVAEANLFLIEKYTDKFKLFKKGLINNLDSPVWKNEKSLVFVGYTTYGNAAYGRYNYDWDKAQPPGYYQRKLKFWEGGAPPYYLNNYAADNHVMSLQLESMNQKILADELRQINNEFWNEMSVSTDFVINKEKAVSKYSPARFLGTLQYGMWIMRPRVVREFTGWHISFNMYNRKAFFEKILYAVDRIYEDSRLAEFWRKGKLVVNSGNQHPYIVALDKRKRFESVNRCYLLTVSTNPDIESLGNQLKKEIEVFALTLLIEEENKPRRWMVYAHAPKGDINKKVTIEIPGYYAGAEPWPLPREIEVQHISQSGSFFFIDESKEDYWVY